MRKAGSELERAWLRFLDERGLRLPTDAQVFIESCRTRPDFVYHDFNVVIYIDGPPHGFADRHKRDVEQTEALEDRGYGVIRFGHEDDWTAIIAKYPNVFGKTRP
jgi:very-short-patch-repair endonuclease